MPAACSDDCSQVGAHGCDRSAAQSIIGAKFDDYDGRMVLFESGSYAIFAAKRGFAADAGVDHLIIKLFLLQALLQKIDPARALRQAVAGGQTVAEYHDHGR